MMPADMDIHVAGREYLRLGWQPLPLSPRSKAPRRPGWQNRTLIESDVAVEFDAHDNIGLLCGLPSGGLIDVDIDDDAALSLAAASPVATSNSSTRGRVKFLHPLRAGAGLIVSLK